MYKCVLNKRMIKQAKEHQKEQILKTLNKRTTCLYAWIDASCQLSIRLLLLVNIDKAQLLHAQLNIINRISREFGVQKNSHHPCLNIVSLHGGGVVAQNVLFFYEY